MEARDRKSRRLRRMGSLIGGLLLSLWCVVFIGLGPDAAGFIDIPSLAITLGIWGGGLLAGFGWRNLTTAWAIFLSGTAESAQAARVAMDICSAGIRLSIASGIIGTLIGSINMLAQGMDDISCLTSGTAVALITVLYGILLSGAQVALRGRAKLALAEWEERRRVYHAPRPQALTRWEGIKYGLLFPLWLIVMVILGVYVVSSLVAHLQRTFF